MSRNLLNWGVFLIALGAIPLAVQAGVLDAAVAQRLLGLWPLMLVGIGVGLLLRVTPIAVLGGVIVAATAGVLVGAVVATRIGGVGGFEGGCGGGPAAGQVTSRDGTFAGGAARVDLELTCVGLTVERQAGTGWAVEASHGGDRPPRIEEGADQLSVAADGGPTFFFLGGGGRADWRVMLPQQPVLSTSVTLNASSAAIDLGGGPLDSIGGTFNASDVRLDGGAATELRSLSMTWNASSGTLVLPPASVSGDMTLNASSVTLCVPPETGLRLSHRSTLSSDNFDELGLTRVADAWQTPDFATAAERIDLSISSNVSSLEASRDGGCQ